MATTVPCGTAWSPSSSPATDVGSVAGWAFAANRQHVPLDRDAQGRWVHARHIHFDDELVTASIDVDWRSECSGGASPKPGRERVESRHRHGGPPLCVVAAFAFVLDFRAVCQTVKPDDYSEPRRRRRKTEPRRGKRGLRPGRSRKFEASSVVRPAAGRTGRRTFAERGWRDRSRVTVLLDPSAEPGPSFVSCALGGGGSGASGAVGLDDESATAATRRLLAHGVSTRALRDQG